MRALSCLVLMIACAPKVAPRTAFDEDLPQERTGATQALVVETPRPEAPPGKGLRSGTIERAKLIAVLDGGAGAFLRQLEVAPRLDGQRFVGWQLVQLLDRNGPLFDVDLVPGDVLLAVNGKQLSRPDQLQTLWDSLRTANELRAQLWRGDTKLELAFAIEPRVDTTTAMPTPMPPPASTATPPASTATPPVTTATPPVTTTEPAPAPVPPPAPSKPTKPTK